MIREYNTNEEEKNDRKEKGEGEREKRRASYICTQKGREVFPLPLAICTTCLLCFGCNRSREKGRDRDASESYVSGVRS